MKYILATAFILAAIPAQAKDVTITLNDEEQKAMIQLLDLAVKSGGLSVADASLHFVRKMQETVKPVPPAPKGAAEPEKK